MKKIYSRLLTALTATALSISLPLPLRADSPAEKVIIVNEGGWQQDNGRLSYFEDGRVVSNQWFRDVNGRKLGDTPNDIIHVKENLIAISVNWSNIIQFIDASGRAVGATEDIPNNRHLATDGQYLYVSSYGHECTTVAGTMQFTKGFVAKIELDNFKVLSAVEVGWEPEGIAYYDGKLFVANSGGYAFQEDHDYEQTVSVIDALSMTTVRTINTGQPNLYGKMSQSGQYLCISSPGDYYDIPAATIIFDCRAALTGASDADCFSRLNYAATYNTTATNGSFYAIGSSYSYLTGGYQFNYLTIDPAAVMDSRGQSGVSASLPGSLMSDIQAMTTPYGIYVNPYTGYIYATDAGGYSEAGTLYQWNPQGQLQGKFGLYINPGHFLALNPAGESRIADITADDTDADDPDAPVYDLMGRRIANPLPGQIYIRNGRKFIAR